MVEIKWSENAVSNYIDVIDQLFEKWNFEIIERFEKQVADLIERISIHNHICPKSKIANLHRCVVNEHVSLIYTSAFRKVVIVSLVFNQSAHKF